MSQGVENKLDNFLEALLVSVHCVYARVPASGGLASAYVVGEHF